MTFDPDRPDAHIKPRKTDHTPHVTRLGWRKVSDYGIESLCGRFRIGRYQVSGTAQFALWDCSMAVWRGLNPDEARKIAAKLWKPA